MSNSKKYFVHFFLIALGPLLGFNICQAQDWQFSLKAGPQISGIAIKPGNDDDNKVGFFAGVCGSKNISENLNIQPEIQISFQGDEVDGLTYLNIPVVLEYFFTDQISAHAGLQAGILLGGEGNIEDFLKTADLGIPLGGEYQINHQFGVGLRYIFGVTNILDVDTEVDLFNRVFQIYATYNIN